MATIIAQVTAMVRGRVAACRDNSGLIGPAGTIPDEALFAAATIARDALIGSLPLSEGVSEVRKEELRKAHEFLTAISTCAVSIDATGAESSGPSICGSYGGYPYLHF